MEILNSHGIGDSMGNTFIGIVFIVINMRRVKIPMTLKYAKINRR